MLKLLKKSEIDVAKAHDRQRDIDEGLKLARRVDSLRETQAMEEAALEKFRKETLIQINEEIVSKTKERNELIKEVSDLEDRRAEALLPLDDKWMEVNEKEEEVLFTMVTLNEKHLILQSKEADHAIEAELLKEEKKRISDERDRSIKELAKADENHEKSRQVLREAQGVKDSALLLKENVLKELKERDVLTASKERELNLKEKSLEKERKALEKEKIRLADQRATLERAMKIYGKR